MVKNHLVVCTYEEDTGLPVYTCRTVGCNRATIRQYENMTKLGWDRQRFEFHLSHPCDDDEIQYENPFFNGAASD